AAVRRRVVREVRGAGAAQRREVRSHLRRVGGPVPGLDDPGVLPLPGERGRLAAARDVDALHVVVLEGDELLVAQVFRLLVQAVLQGRRRQVDLRLVAFQDDRSEEHTSELQSRSDLVCRLLLEKKKKKKKKSQSFVK